MLHKLFGFLPWHMTLLVVLTLWGLSALSLAVAQTPEVVYNLPFWGASLLTFALALSIAALIYSQGLLVDPLFSQLPPPLNWLLYGGLAEVGAMGGYDLLKSILGLVVSNATLPQPAPTAAQAEAQVNAVPKLAIEGLKALAASLVVCHLNTDTAVSRKLSWDYASEEVRCRPDAGRKRKVAQADWAGRGQSAYTQPRTHPTQSG